MTNRLIHETSPYLLQHAENPVDWYAWGPEALEKARAENKPIFLSIGYAACHWCHVMEHESFEDPETARMLNDHFVSIKVDREERPDLDSIYMNAVVTMTGQGGWPMSVFLTPQGEPFYGGTYFPPTRRHGMPAFREVLKAVAQAWESDPGEMRKTAQELAQHLDEGGHWGDQSGAVLRPETLQQATQALLNSYDWRMGGWGRAPRFPQPMSIEFLLLQASRGVPKALDAAAHNLEIMSRGGLYDIVGGGFHRYSTDDTWLVPHFEKMLYDNAQLALAYLHAAAMAGRQAPGEGEGLPDELALHFRAVCTETLDFILREMTHPQGGFYSSLDADSEGEEGKYYVWTPDELAQALSEDEKALFDQVYPVTPRGNFEGKNILQRQESIPALAQRMGMSAGELLGRLDAIHKKLYQAREARVRPATDDKVLISWNALALRAFAEAARFLQRPGYLEAARKNAAFILDHMIVDGRLLRAWRDGQARHNAYLEDHAALILGLLALYQSDPNPRWYQATRSLAGEMLAHFRDPEGGFFDTRSDHGELITRPKEIQDNATPCGNSLAVNALLQLAAFDEQQETREIAEKSLAVLQTLMVRHPTAFAMWLQGLDFATGPVRQVAIIGSPEAAETNALIEALWESYRPRTILAAAGEPVEAGIPVSGEEGAGSDYPALLHGRPLQHGQPTAYVCQGFVCNLPVTDPAAMKQQLEA